MPDSYDKFASGLSLTIIPERFSSLTQRVTSIYHRDYFAGLKKLCQKYQVLLVWFPQVGTQLPIPHH